MTAAVEQAPASSRFLTVSNMLSLSRAVLVIPFVLVMLSDVPHARVWGFALLALAALTDRLDGVLARRLGEVTEWGKVLDPLADKVGVASVALVLLWLGDLPVWFVVAILGRDILIAAGGVYLKHRTGLVLPSNEVGKWAVGVISLVLGLAVLGVHSVVTTVLIIITCIMLAISLVLYATRFTETLREVKVVDHGTA